MIKVMWSELGDKLKKLSYYILNLWKAENHAPMLLETLNTLYGLNLFTTIQNN